MKSRLYCVKDVLAGVCLPPVVFDNDRAAARAFGDAVLKGDTPISQHPTDFVMLFIGEFDREHGDLFAAEISIVAHGDDFITKGDK